jgi:uncharacterized protein (DUF433 family)
MKRRLVLQETEMEIAPRIKVDAGIRFGKAVISGTRVPVHLIVAKLAAGMNYEEVMAEYDVSREDILAALDYAAKALSGEEIRVLD